MADIVASLELAMQTQFGRKIDLSPTSPVRKLLEAYGSLGVAEDQADLLEIQRQAYPETATSENLHRVLFTQDPLAATRATGTVNVTWSSSLASPPEPDPFFEAGTLTFYDTAGRSYLNTEDVSVSGASSAIAVEATFLGTDGNIAAGTITQMTATDSTVANRWSTNIQSFTNNAAFSGGQDAESDVDYLRRFQLQKKSKPESSPDGLITAIQRLGLAVRADVVNNPTKVGLGDEFVFDGTAYADNVSSESISGGTYTKIAQKFTLAANERFWIEDYALKLKTNNSLVGTVRVETDSSGSPSGTLAHANLVKSSFTFSGTTRQTGKFDSSLGAFIEAGASPTSFWLVFTRTSGDGVFDGSTETPADKVKVWDTSGTPAWVLSSTVENIAADVITGVPPNSYRAVVDLDTVAATELAQVLHDCGPLGIYADGKLKANATDKAGRPVPYRYNTPTIASLYVDVELNVTDEFTGDVDSIKDLVVEYIGGTDTKGKIHKGLVVSERFTYSTLYSRLRDTSYVVGTDDIVVLEVGTSASPSGTTNLTPARGTKYRITNLAHISVTINTV